MFDLDPGDDLALVVETARRFAETELRPALRDSETARAVSGQIRDAYAEIGLAALEISEDLGGAGLDCIARVLVNEELGAADAGAALALDPFGPALYPLLEGLDPAAHALAAWTNTLAREPGARAVLVCLEDGQLHVEGERLTGTVPWVPSDRFDSVIVMLENEALILDGGVEYCALRGAGLRAAGASELGLQNAQIAQRIHGADAIARARARARLYVASLMLGVMRHACDFSREYAREREAFGRPIAHHQALAFLITDMQMALDGARLLVHEAAWRLETHSGGESEAASAYAQCIETSRLIGPAGVQILGGHGFMADYPMEKTMRETRALGLMFGGFDAAIEEAGRALCASEDRVQFGAVEGR
jgi:alkylation response protein AidB-like acyl-CoA dehydrogenase